MFIPLPCSLSQIPFDTRALQGPVIPGHWIRIKTSPGFFVFFLTLCSAPLFSSASCCFFPGSALRGHKYNHLSWVMSCKTCHCESVFGSHICLNMLFLAVNVICGGKVQGHLHRVVWCKRSLFLSFGGVWGGVVALRQHLYLVVKPSLGNRLLEVAWIINRMMSSPTKAVCHFGLFSN